MKKIIFCDLNEKLVKDVTKLFKKHKENKWNIELSTHFGDIFEYQKTNGGLIATASNPSFSMGGGLDAQIAINFPDEIKSPREFKRTEHLFFTVTVDDFIKANEKIVERALIGAFGYAENEVIISGFGTAIGGLSSKKFLEILEQVLTADLSSANLRSADLSYADLRSADLSSANLRSANLRSADLSYADLRSADLSYADLSYADLSYANLRYAENLELVAFNESTAFFALSCPEEGSFVAWKKCNNALVKLEIPTEAQRSSATSRKCRAEFAKVISIEDLEGNELQECKSSYDSKFIYKVGEIVKPKEKYEKNRWIECASGIHFFITKQEAKNWN